MAGSIARIPVNSSRPRRPGIGSSSRTRLYGCRRSSASASSPCVADATVKPCSSRKRRCAASPSISSSTQRMLFGRGIVAKANTRDYNWPRVVRPARAVQLHRRHPAHHAPRPRAATPAPRGTDRLRHEAGHDPPRLGQPARPRSGGPGAGRADPPPRAPAAGARGRTPDRAGAGSRARHQTLAPRPLDRARRPAARGGVPARGAGRAGGPRTRPAARGGRGDARRAGRERGRRVLAAGDGRAAGARAGARLGGHGRDAHGDGRGYTRGRTVRTDGGAVRLLPLPRPRGRAGAPARLPPLLGHRHGALSDGPPPLPRRHRARGGRGGLAAARRMIRATTPCEEQLIELLAAAGRGPARDGVFALWLVLRAAEALLTPQPRPVSSRGHRRRLQALETRLASLALPGPLKRALAAARQHLEPGTPAAAAGGLSPPRAPPRDGVGPEAGHG